MSKVTAILSGDALEDERTAIRIMDEAISVKTHTRALYPMVELAPIAFGLSDLFARFESIGHKAGIVWFLSGDQFVVEG